MISLLAATALAVHAGDASLPIGARVVVDVGAGNEHVEESTRNDAGTFVVEELADSYDSVLRLATQPDGTITVDLETRWLRDDVAVSRLAVDLTLPGAVSAVGRDLVFGRVTDGGLRVDRGTPILAEGGGLVLTGGPGFSAAHYVGNDVELIADDEASHPFTAYDQCRKTYLPPAKPGEPRSTRPPESMEKRSAHDRIVHHEGDVTVAHAYLAVVPAFAPVILQRWAGAARAAVVFTDHADRTDPAALRAILYGSSDPTAPGYGKGGFIGHGLALTKTFFVKPGRGTLDDDPDARALADEIVAAGGEVGPHSVTPERDKRDATSQLLPHVSAWKPVTWIDHQPETNCEAMTNRGWSDDPDFGGLAPILVNAGYQWVWAAKDVDAKGSVVANAFVPDKPGIAWPPIYPLPIEPRLWMFDSAWFYSEPGKLAKALDDASLDRLEKERGLFVAHTYLSASARTTSTPYLRDRDAVVEHGSTLTIEPRLDAALAKLGTRVASGTIASLTWRAAGARLRALGDVAVVYRPDGVTVTNAGAIDLPGLGVELGGRVQTFDLPAGKSVTLDGAPRAQAATLTVDER